MSNDNRIKKSYYDRFFWIIPVYVVFIIVCGIALKSFWFVVIALIIGFILIFNTLERKDAKEIAKIKKRIEEGDLNAQLELGDYLMSTHSNENLEEAQKWYEKSVEQGLAGSQSKLDECRKKIQEKAEEAARQKAKADQKSAIEAERPVCKQCGKKYDYSNQWTVPPFCSMNCRATYNGTREGQRRANEL